MWIAPPTPCGALGAARARVGRQRGSPPRPRSAPGRGGLGGGRVAPAWGAEVVSSNIVGYQKVNLRAGFNLVASQFLLVGGETKDIQDYVEADNTMPGLDENGSFQTTMRVWTGTGYSTYGWLNATDGTANEVPEWNSKWVLEDSSDLADVDMNVGDGYWVICSEAATATFAGEVPSTDGNPSVSVSQGFNLIANPLPADINIQNIQPSASLLGLDENGSFQTTMRVWTGTGYSTYGWLDADDGTANEVPEWNSKWVLEDSSDLANVTVGIGEGFWLISPSASGSVSFIK